MSAQFIPRLESRSEAMLRVQDAQRQLTATQRASEANASSTLVCPPPVLCVVTFFFERDPVIQFTMPMRSQPLWGRLESKRRANVAETFAPEALYREVVSGIPAPIVPWVVVSSTHTAEPLVVHAEDLRLIMVELSPSLPHCVLDANGISLAGHMFWESWEYMGVLTERARLRLTSSAARRGGPVVKHHPSCFPGELLRPLPSSHKDESTAATTSAQLRVMRAHGIPQ